MSDQWETCKNVTCVVCVLWQRNASHNAWHVEHTCCHGNRQKKNRKEPCLRQGNKHTLSVHMHLRSFHALQNTWQLLSLNASNFRDVFPHQSGNGKWQSRYDAVRCWVLPCSAADWAGRREDISLMTIMLEDRRHIVTLFIRECTNVCCYVHEQRVTTPIQQNKNPRRVQQRMTSSLDVQKQRRTAVMKKCSNERPWTAECWRNTITMTDRLPRGTPTLMGRIPSST
jgi:hypothetical protein